MECSYNTDEHVHDERERKNHEQPVLSILLCSYDFVDADSRSLDDGALDRRPLVPLGMILRY